MTFIILALEKDGDTDTLPMVGDVNLFLKGHPEDEDFEAEVEVMIAGMLHATLCPATRLTVVLCTEHAYRRRGFALEALKLMLIYATDSPEAFTGSPLSDDVPRPPKPLPIAPRCLVVRISQDNQPSISLFEKLRFVVTKMVHVFGEVEMRFLGNTSDLVQVG